MSEHIDRVGQELEVGDTIVYPTYNDSRMVIGTIEEIIDYEVTRRKYEKKDDGSYEFTDYYQEPRWKAKIQPIPEHNKSRATGWRYIDGKYQTVPRKPKTVVIERVGNLVKVELPNG